MMANIHKETFLAWVVWTRLVNMLALAVNLADKLCAIYHCYRIPEFFLHCLSLMGGAPATALSIWIFCHCSTKTPYQNAFIDVCKAHGFLVVIYCLGFFLKTKGELELQCYSRMKLYETKILQAKQKCA